MYMILHFASELGKTIQYDYYEYYLLSIFVVVF